MKRVVPTQPGLSYVDANANRLVTYGPDVMDVKRQIETEWDTLYCVFDLEQEEWIIIEKCGDGVERLVLQPLKPAEFTTRVIDRIRRASKTSPEDVLKAVDAHNDGLDRQEDHTLAEIAGDAGERLMHAFKKDGLYDHLDIYGVTPKRGNIANRAVRPHVERSVA